MVLLKGGYLALMFFGVNGLSLHKQKSVVTEECQCEEGDDDCRQQCQSSDDQSTEPLSEAVSVAAVGDKKSTQTGDKKNESAVEKKDEAYTAAEESTDETTDAAPKDSQDAVVPAEEASTESTDSAESTEGKFTSEEQSGNSRVTADGKLMQKAPGATEETNTAAKIEDTKPLDSKKIANIFASPSLAQKNADDSKESDDDCECQEGESQGKTPGGDDCDCILDSSADASEDEEEDVSDEVAQTADTKTAEIQTRKPVPASVSTKVDTKRVEKSAIKTAIAEKNVEKKGDDCDCILDSHKGMVNRLNPKEECKCNLGVQNLVLKKAEKAKTNRATLKAGQPNMLNDAPPPQGIPAPAPAAPAPTVAPVIAGPIATPVGSVDPLQAKCNEVMSRADAIRASIALWSDHTTWNGKIAADKAVVEKETTPGLADMLADTRYELHQLAVPVFVEVLTEKLEMILKEHDACMAELESSRQELTAVGAVEEEAKKEFKRISWPTMILIAAVGIFIVYITFRMTQRQPQRP